MKKVAHADITEYGVPAQALQRATPPGSRARRESGLKSFWIGMSHYLPGGGIEWSGEDSAEEKVYFVIEGELTVKGEDEDVRARPPRLALHRPERGPVGHQQRHEAGRMLVVVNT